jgi:hypothetical protein
MSLPMLQTARLLLLRPLQEDDAEGLHTAYGDADAMRFLGLPAYRDAPPPSACRVDPWGPAHLPCAVSRRISSIYCPDTVRKSSKIVRRGGGRCFICRQPVQ